MASDPDVANGFEDLPPSNPFSYLFGPDNQNSSGGFTYDGSGNPTQYNNSAAGAYAYDPEQRLTAIGTGFSAHYDGDGMRDYVTTGGTTTYYVYDGGSPILEETYAGSTATIQVANGMADGWRERYAASSFGFNAYGFDPQGSLSVEDSSFDTTLPAQNEYVFDGYGDRLVGERVSNGSTTAFNVDPVQFGGQYGYYTDTSTGEVDLTHRYYDTATGHFLNRDPIGYNGGQNLYAFCGNNPITRSDPSGYVIQFDYGTTSPENEKLWHQAIAYLEKCPKFRDTVLKEIRGNQDEVWTVYFDNDYNSEAHNTELAIYWDPHFDGPQITSKGKDTGHSNSPALVLGHELAHVYHWDTNAPSAMSPVQYPEGSPDARYDNSEEKATITGWERILDHCLHEPVRDSHEADPDDPNVKHHVKSPTEHR